MFNGIVIIDGGRITNQPDVGATARRSTIWSIVGSPSQTLGHTRSFVGRRPQTTYRITKIGRAALWDYVATTQSLIDAVQIVDCR